MVLLCTILTSSACAQHFIIRILPQYKTASLFTKQGYAVVTDTYNTCVEFGPGVPITNAKIVCQRLVFFFLSVSSVGVIPNDCLKA